MPRHRRKDSSSIHLTASRKKKKMNDNSRSTPLRQSSIYRFGINVVLLLLILYCHVILPVRPSPINSPGKTGRRQQQPQQQQQD